MVPILSITHQHDVDDLKKEFNDYQKSHDNHDKKVLLWDKNLILFPRKIDNKFCFLHRIFNRPLNGCYDGGCHVCFSSRPYL